MNNRNPRSSLVPVTLIQRPATVLAVALALTACTGGSGGDSSSGGSLIPTGGSDTPASEVGTDQIVQNAARSVGTSLEANLGGLQTMFSDASAANDNTTTAGIGTSLGAQLDTFGLSLPVDTETVTGGNLLGVPTGLIGLDAAQAETTSRDGDLITIDPDDARLCQEIMAALDGQVNEADCLAVAAQITVEIEAVTEDTGIVHYYYANQEVLKIGYAPNATSAELSLAPLRLFLGDVEALDPTIVESELPEAMTGVLRWNAEVLSDVAGQEAGTAGFSVVSAIAVSDNSGNDSFTMAPSNVLSVSFDNATGTANLTLNAGSIQAMLSMDDEFAVPGEAASVTSVSLAGVTGSFDYDEMANRIVGTNIGIGNAPLSVSVDGNSMLNAQVQTFGATVNGDTNELVIDTPFNLNVSAGGVEPGQTMSIGVTAAAGTGLMPVGDAADMIQLTAGGPLSISVVGPDGEGGTINDSVVIVAGECFSGDSTGDDTGSSFLTVTPCP